jgi:GxxExxY protein
MGNVNENFLHSETTEQIIQAYYHVYNTLGFGFIEKIYENSLAITLRKRGFEVLQQEPVSGYFEGEFVGEYKADLIVDRKVIIELKSVETFHSRHEVQLLNYLRATPIEVGLLMNFGDKPEFKRRIFSNERKSHPTNNQ